MPIPAPVSLDKYPCITYQIISDTSELTLDLCSIETMRIQFNCFSTQCSDVRTLTKAIKKVMNGYIGALNDSVYVHCCTALNIFDGFIDTERLYEQSIQLTINYTQTED